MIPELNLNKKVFIVAEIGNNHEGSISNAKKMIDLAKDAGADCVKFQTIKPNELIKKSDKARINQLKKFELKKKDFFELYDYAKKKEILFSSTPFYLSSVKWLSEIVCFFKVSSGDFTFFPLIKELFKYDKPIFISTGMVTSSEIFNFFDYFKEDLKNFKKQLCLMYCISDYPTNKKLINLNSINFLSQFCDFPGFSDHSIGINFAVDSISFGAKVIEKHFTLDKNFSDFRDHKISLDYTEFKKMVKEIRKAEQERIYVKQNKAHKKTITPDEKKNRKLFRRGIYAKKNIEKGKKIKINDLIFLRPKLEGISPAKVNLFLDKISSKRIYEGELMDLTMVKN
tara:strand:- start:50825 stop:51847 length:1023 start_codon:yes stop_codon:yes gene_type:complete